MTADFYITYYTKEGEFTTPNMFGFENGELHRIDGPAIICDDGREEWWYEGKLHRKDGPAIITADGTKAWFIHGLQHREDGPAEIAEAFNGVELWYLNDKLIEPEQWFKENNIDPYNMTEEDIVAFILRWS